MEPAIRYGRAGRDPRVLPDDEYVERMLDVRGALAASDLDALAVFGHAAAGGAFVYLAGYVPTMGFSALLVTPGDEPVLISASGPRDIPFVQAQTWIADVRPSPSLLEDAVAGVVAAVAERLRPGARIGLVGAATNLDAGSHARLHGLLQDYSLADGTPVLETLRRRKRPRELAVLAQAAALARGAAAAGAEAGGARSAIGMAQRHGRIGGAHDVRVLVRAGGTFVPASSRTVAELPTDVTVYCAVELSGYWGEAIAPASAAAELATLAARARPGVDTASFAGAAGEYGAGGGVGNERVEAPYIEAESGDAFRLGDVVALRVISDDTAAAGIFRIGQEGAVAL
ncbi:MAG TPA: aminopeptidase P family N-terminal domain-containing protein [Gaiellaceae bacterium]